MASKKTNLVAKNVKNPLFSTGIANLPEEEFTQGVLLVPPPKESDQLLTKGLGGEVDTFLGQDVTDLGLSPLSLSENSDQCQKLLPPPPPTLTNNFSNNLRASLRPLAARSVDPLSDPTASRTEAEPDFKQIPLDDSIPLYNPSAVLRSSHRDNSHELNRIVPPLDAGVPLFDPSCVGSVLPPHATKRPLSVRTDTSHGPTQAPLEPAYSSLSKHIATCNPSLVTDSGPPEQTLPLGGAISSSRKSSGSSSVHELHSFNSVEPKFPPTLPSSVSTPSLHSISQKTSHLLSQTYQTPSSLSLFPQSVGTTDSALVSNIVNNTDKNPDPSLVPLYSTGTCHATNAVPLYPVQPITSPAQIPLSASLPYSNSSPLVTPSPIRLFPAPPSSSGPVPAVFPASNFVPTAPTDINPPISNFLSNSTSPETQTPNTQNVFSQKYPVHNGLESSDSSVSRANTSSSVEYSIPSFLNPLNLFKRGNSPATKPEVPQNPSSVSGNSDGRSLTAPQSLAPSILNSSSPPSVLQFSPSPSISSPSTAPPTLSSNPLPPPPLTGFQISSTPLSSLPKIHHTFSTNPYSVHSLAKITSPTFKPEHYFTPIPVDEVSQIDSQESFQTPDLGPGITRVTEPRDPSFLNQESVHQNIPTEYLPGNKKIEEFNQVTAFPQSSNHVSESALPISSKIHPNSIQPAETAFSLSGPALVTEKATPQSSNTVENPITFFSNEGFSAVVAAPPSVPLDKIQTSAAEKLPPLLSAPIEPSLSVQVPKSALPPPGPLPNPIGPPPTLSHPNSYRLSSLKRPTYAPVPDLGISSSSRPIIMSQNQDSTNSNTNQGFFQPTTTTSPSQSQVPPQNPLKPPPSVYSFQEPALPDDQTAQVSPNLASPAQYTHFNPSQQPPSQTVIPSSIQTAIETPPLVGATSFVHPPQNINPPSFSQIPPSFASPLQPLQSLAPANLSDKAPTNLSDSDTSIPTKPAHSNLTHTATYSQSSPVQTSGIESDTQNYPLMSSTQPQISQTATSQTAQTQASPVPPSVEERSTEQVTKPSPPESLFVQSSASPTAPAEESFGGTSTHSATGRLHLHPATPLPTEGERTSSSPGLFTSHAPYQPFTAMSVVQTYRPVYHHWFYRRGDEKKNQWFPFSMADSLNLEQQFTSDVKTEGNKVVATDGGRYDVDVLARKRKAVYWHENAGDVRRCSWFVKGPIDSKYQPYDENIATLLEEEYKTACTKNEWNRRVELADGEVIIIHSPNAIAHHQRSSSPDPWGNPPPMAEKPRVVKRGLDEFDIPEGEPTQVDHLLLLVHGIGKVCDLRFRSLVEVVDDFRNISVSLVGSHYKSAVERGKVGRVEVLPVEWHRALHTDAIDQRLADITLPSIPKARQFTNETLLDILFYTSPVFCEKIVEAVGAELNRVYSLYLKRNPGYRGGVSLGGHSLGSLILFDMLCHQKPPHPKLTSTPSFCVDEEDEDVSSLGCLKTRARLSRRMSYLTIGTAGTGQPYIAYPQLNFQPRAFFALGSPIGMFVTVRGIESLGEEFKFPTCPSFFNIFHPNDPVAYRMEGLINPEMAHHPAVLIPHHKGRKRMHLELKETMAHLTAAVKHKLLDSVKNTWNTVSSFTRFTRLDHATLENQVDKVLEDEMLCKERSDDSASSVSDSVEVEGADLKVGVLNGGRRIDYVLQEAPLETFNQYISAVRSHLVYWESEDTMLLVLKEIYSNKGITADCQVPQPILPFDLTPEANADPGTAYTHYTVSPSPSPSRQHTISEEPL